MAISKNTKTDYTFKRIKGRVYTTLDKAWFEETSGKLVYPHSSDVWIDDIPKPAPNNSTDVVEYIDDLKLTVDKTVGDNKAWLVCLTPNDLSTRIVGFVPPSYDITYTVRIFEDDGNGSKGNEISTTHPSNWLFDYENGVLTFENDPTSFGITLPIHISVYRYIGRTLTEINQNVENKLKAFIRETSTITVSAGSASVDVTDIFNGKNPNGSVSSTGIVTTEPYNKVIVLQSPSRDEIATNDGNKVYGRLNYDSTNEQWIINFYYLANDGQETAYTFKSNTDIIVGYLEVLDFKNWPVFDDNISLTSDQIVAEIPDATTENYGKVKLATDEEVNTDNVVTTKDKRIIKTNDFALFYTFSEQTSTLSVTIKPGVYNNKGDVSSEYSYEDQVSSPSSHYFYITSDGTINHTEDKNILSATDTVLWSLSIDENGNVTVSDLRPVYTYSVGGGEGPIGIPSDGSYDDGLLQIHPTEKVKDAIDDINEVLKYLAPPNADPLSGDINWANSKATGKISDGIALNYLSPGDSAICIRDSELNGSLPDPSHKFNYANKGQLKVFVNDSEVDSFDLEAYFDKQYKDGCQNYTPATTANGVITVTSVCAYNDFPLWQKGNATIKLNNLEVGDLKVYALHTYNGNNDKTNDSVIFCDLESSRPALQSAPTLQEDTPQFKYLSGIKLYTLNSTFKLNVTTNNRIFEYTYVDEPLVVEFDGCDTFSIPINDSSVSGVSPIPKYNEQMVVSDKIITVNKANISSLNAVVKVTPRDPWGDGTSVTESPSGNRLLNTYGSISTDIAEYFQDEKYRLPSSYNFDDYSQSVVNQWDSTSLLSNGNAQVLNGRLIYPNKDYTSGYLPSQTANYSSFSGSQVYYRAFIDTNDPHNNGRIRLGGITKSDIGSNIEVYIKLPTQTGWLSLQDDFNIASFTGNDNEGARTSIQQDGSDVIIGWTSSTFSTANSGYRIYVKVVLKSQTTYITKLIEEGW